MNLPDAVRVLRRSPGRLRVHAPGLGGERSQLEGAVSATRGVLEVRWQPRTGNILIDFDESMIDGPSVLALLQVGPATEAPVPTGRGVGRATDAPERVGWLRVERTETFDLQPANCVAVLTDFERYPEWQTYVTDVTVLRRDRRGRGTSVLARAAQARVATLGFARSLALTSARSIELAPRRPPTPR